MSRKKLQGYELRFGLVQLVMGLGVITGSMVCAFYFGYQSGRDAGYETASADSLSRAIRLPISDEELQQEVPEDQASRVYAKLGVNNLETEIGEEAAPVELGTREIAPIASIDSAPIVVERKGTEREEELIEDDISLGTALLEQEEKKSTPKEESAIRVLGETPALVTGGTLGGLFELKNEPQKTEDKKQQEPVQAVAIQLEQKSIESLPKREPVQSVVENTTSPETGRSVAGKGEMPSVALSQRDKEESIEPPKAVTPGRVSPTVPSTPRSGWYVQVAAPKARSDAETLSQRLRSSGFQVAIETANVRGERYFRVLVGPEENRTLAQRLSSQVKREPYVQGDPFIKTIR